MYAGYVVSLLLIIIFCTSIAFVYVKGAGQNGLRGNVHYPSRDDGEEDEDAIADNIRELQKQLVTINSKLRENDNVYRKNIDALERQLNVERSENSEYENEMSSLRRELEAEREDKVARLEEKRRELIGETQQLDSLRAQLSEERTRSGNTEVRLTSTVRDLETDLQRQQERLRAKESEHKAIQERLRFLESQLAAEKRSGEEQLGRQRDNLRLERTQREEELKNRERELLLRIEAMRRQQQQQGPQPQSRPSEPVPRPSQPRPQSQQAPSYGDANDGAKDANVRGIITATVSGTSVYDDATRRQLPSRPNSEGTATGSHTSSPAGKDGGPVETAPPSTVRPQDPGSLASTSTVAVGDSTENGVPVEQRFVKYNEIAHDKNWVDVSKLTVVMTSEIRDAIAASTGSTNIADEYCVVKIPDSALPPGSSIERRVKKSLQVGENRDGEPKRFARMKVIMSGETAPTLIFHDYTPVIRHYAFYDFANDTMSDKKGCAWKEFAVHSVYLGTQRLEHMSKIALLVKWDGEKKPEQQKKNTGNRKR